MHKTGRAKHHVGGLEHLEAQPWRQIWRLVEKRLDHIRCLSRPVAAQGGTEPPTWEKDVPCALNLTDHVQCRTNQVKRLVSPERMMEIAETG